MDPIKIDITILAPVKKYGITSMNPNILPNGILPMKAGIAPVLKTI
jgi:hypothetical protein